MKKVLLSLILILCLIFQPISSNAIYQLTANIASADAATPGTTTKAANGSDSSQLSQTGIPIATYEAGQPQTGLANPQPAVSTPTTKTTLVTPDDQTAIPIYTAQDLYNVRNNLSGNYIQMNDIDLSGYSNWTPIGDQNNLFTGTYDGGNYKITGLSINGAFPFYVGLFEYAYNTSFTNVHISNCSVTVSNSDSDMFVGGLVGRATSSTITNCSVTGSITANTTDAYTSVGGLVGEANSSTITNCYATESINDNAEGTFGLAEANAGGLVGYTDTVTAITNCYATGSITANTVFSYIAGLVGDAYDETTITNCYAAESIMVTGGDLNSLINDKFAIVPYPDSVSIINCYYDMDLPDVPDQPYFTGTFGTPEPTTAMMQQATFQGWDFTNTWGIHEGTSYPYLLSVGNLPPCMATLGDCPYVLFSRNSVNLSTGNFIHQETDFDIPTEGSDLAFTRFYNSQDSYVGPQGRGWTSNLNAHLTINSGSISVAYPDGHVYTFASNSGSYTAPAGCYETLAAGPGSGYTLTFKNHTEYIFNSSGQLTSIVDKNANTITLAYNGNNLLASATDPTGQISFIFNYNSNNQLQSITDPLRRSVSYTYYPSGELATVTGLDGGITQCQYDPVTGSLSAIIQPDGNTLLANTYNGSNQVTQQVDGNNNTWQFAYTSGQTTMTGALNGKPDTTTYTYDGSYRATILEDSLTNTTSYQYGDSINPFLPTSVTYAQGTAESVYCTYSYDLNGNTLSCTNNTSGAETECTYTNNNLHTVTVFDPNTGNADNATYKYYPNSNNMETITESAIDPVTKQPVTINYSYYSDGQLKSETDPGVETGPGTSTQNPTQYGYDSYGHLSSATDPSGVVTGYSYDEVGRIQSESVGGNTTNYTCDAAGNVTKKVDPEGHTWGYAYDLNGNLKSATDPNNNPPPSGSTAKSYQYTYDGENLLSTAIDPLGNLTQYSYDSEDHLSQVTDPNGHTTKYAYFQNGWLQSVTDDTVASGAGIATSYTCYPTGRTETMTNVNGTTTYNYDPNFNLSTVQDAKGNTHTYKFDPYMQYLNTVQDPNQNTTTYTHNPASGFFTGTTETINGTNISASQGNDASGDVTSQVDPKGNNDQYYSDAAGRPSTVILPGGQSSSDTYYTTTGLLETATDFNGNQTSYQYNTDNSLQSFTDPVGTVSYGYDANGNIQTVQNASGTTTRTYDADNRVTSYTDAGGHTIQYRYDNAGNLTLLAYPDGNTVQYQHDSANRLTKVIDWKGRTTQYQYTNGLLAKTIWPDGSYQELTYYPNGWLEEQQDFNPRGSVVDQYTLTYDGDGNIKSVQASTPTAAPFIPSNDNVTYSTSSTGDNRALTYNGQNISYDNNGNMTYGPLNGQMAQYNFNARNELTGVGSTTYTYDAEGNRIGAVENNQKITYVVDPKSSLPKVLENINPSGQTDYVYGLGLIGQQDPGGYKTYHFDFRGNTVYLTDIDGNVTDNYQYDAYGEVTYHKGTTNTPLLYDGRDGCMTDANGLIYMRARYYSPDTRRFISRDSVVGSVSNPQTLNSYGYALNNPVGNTDPTGRDVGYNEQTGEVISSSNDDLNIEDYLAYNPYPYAPSLDFHGVFQPNTLAQKGPSNGHFTGINISHIRYINVHIYNVI